MKGVICTRDILFHPILTVRAFGWRVFFRAVFQGQKITFLSLLQGDGFFTATTSKEPELIERCVRLELQSAAIYRSLAQRFAGPFRGFLNELATEEKEHADLLGGCKSIACKGRFVEDRFSPWHDYVPRLEQQMQLAAASLDEIESLDDLVQLILDIEGSEINRVFLGILQATDSPFVKKLGPFRRAVKHHIGYICKTIAQWTPAAAAACRELRAKF